MMIQLSLAVSLPRVSSQINFVSIRKVMKKSILTAKESHGSQTKNTSSRTSMMTGKTNNGWMSKMNTSLSG